MLGLERLIVGRECNAFDRLSSARKSRAFAELIHHGLAYGKVEARMIVVKHPVGGLNAEELRERIEAATKGLTEATSK